MSEVFTHVLDFDSAQPVLCFYFGEVNALLLFTIAFYCNWNVNRFFVIDCC